jgi:TetR/AcrR family transcriptional regulator, transcriptional repressor of bet genes
VAQEAGVAPGLVHHHFKDKAELLSCLLKELVAAHRARVAEREGEPLAAYVDAALALDARADTLAARCWVSLFAEALRDKALYEQMRRLIDAELAATARDGGELDAHDAGALLAYVIGALVLGAYAPRVTAGFAAKGGHAMLTALRGG